MQDRGNFCVLYIYIYTHNSREENESPTTLDEKCGHGERFPTLPARREYIYSPSPNPSIITSFSFRKSKMSDSHPDWAVLDPVSEQDESSSAPPWKLLSRLLLLSDLSAFLFRQSSGGFSCCCGHFARWIFSSNEVASVQA